MTNSSTFPSALSGSVSIAVDADGTKGHLANDRVRLDVDGQSMVLSARCDGAWVPVLRRSGENRQQGQVLFVAVPEGPALELTRLETSACLVVRGKVPEGTLCVAFWLREGEDWVEVTETLAFKRRAAVEVAELKAQWTLSEWTEPGEVFSPHLVPKEGDIVGRHCMRSPALTAETERVAAALVTDVDVLTKQQVLPGFMSLLRQGSVPVFETGLVGQEVRGHVFFRATHTPVRAEILFHGYQLHASAGPRTGSVLATARKRLWARFGSRNLARSSYPRATPGELARESYPRVFDAKWREAEVDGRRIGAITTDRAFPGDVWMCPWFHNLSSAYGLYTWGERLGVSDWTERALAVRELHLAAPLERGLFPTLFTFGPQGQPGTWDGSHPQGGALDALHVGDMSYTQYWLLVFHRELAPDARTVERALSYFEGLTRIARSDAGLPAYVSRETHEPVTHVNLKAWKKALAAQPHGDTYVSEMLDIWGSERFVESSEDALSLMFLGELLKVRELDPAVRARVQAFAEQVAQWIIRRVVDPAWYIDMEVHYSCAPQPLGFHDDRSGQHPQDVVAIWTAAQGLLSLYESTRAAPLLQAAARAMDRLCLHQQIYDPPFLGFDGFGGYAAQNIDGEWSDARQALFAMTHLEFHRVTGDPEHLERAIAACRASFSTLFHPAVAQQYPVGWSRLPVGFAAENHAHSGVDQVCGVSSFHWGMGSALAAAAYLARRGVEPW